MSHLWKISHNNQKDSPIEWESGWIPWRSGPPGEEGEGLHVRGRHQLVSFLPWRCVSTIRCGSWGLRRLRNMQGARVHLGFTSGAQQLSLGHSVMTCFWCLSIAWSDANIETFITSFGKWFWSCGWLFLSNLLYIHFLGFHKSHLKQLFFPLWGGACFSRSSSF